MLIPLAVSFRFNIRKMSYLGKNTKLLSTFQRDETENVEEEWAALEKAEKANADEIKALYRAKLEQWNEMKNTGILEKLSVNEDLSQEIIEDMDKLSKKLIGERFLLKSSKKQMTAEKSLSEHSSGETDKHSKSAVQSEFQEKLKSVQTKKDASLALYNLLNEVKDKGLLSCHPELVQDIMMAISRQDSSTYASAAYDLYSKWCDSEMVPKDTVHSIRSRAKRTKSSSSSTPSFILQYLTSCAANGLTEASRNIATTLLSSNSFTSAQLLPAVICTEVYTILEKKPFRSKTVSRLVQKKQTHNKLQDATLLSARQTSPSQQGVSSEKLSLLLKVFRENIRDYHISEVNLVIRVLGKLKLTEEIFELLDVMRAAGNSPNDESLEFLANAIVYSVEEISTAVSMTDLPSPDMNTPEILFAGRSNVGKSSLVNLLCNRKALASTSATPGHTQAFHFFSVNKDRRDVPSFHIVDVPGMGYAETANNTQVSWRSLLERYLTVRDPLLSVCHLVDSRHGLTDTDKQIIQMISRASIEREAMGRHPFTYTLVLTKTDRASTKQLNKTLHTVEDGTKELASRLNMNQKVPIVNTSSVLKIGRDEMWRILQRVIISNTI